MAFNDCLLIVGAQSLVRALLVWFCKRTAATGPESITTMLGDRPSRARLIVLAVVTSNEEVPPSPYENFVNPEDAGAAKCHWLVSGSLDRNPANASSLLAQSKHLV